MLRSTNDEQSPGGFHLRVRQRPDGQFEATAPGAAYVPPTVGANVQIVTAQHSDKLRAALRAGKHR